MTAGEFLIRSILTGLAIGVPAAFVGQRSFEGRRLPTSLVAGIGGLGGFLAGIASLAEVADPLVLLLVALALSVAVGVMFTWIPEAHNRWARK